MDVKPVIVGVDGSPDSVRALQWAAEHARLIEAPLHGVISWEVATIYGDTFFGKQDFTAVEEKNREVLEGAVRKALGEGAQVEARIERGNASEVLVRASRDAQLVVVGSRGHGGFTGMLLGSVSQHLVTHARCPVLVMPHGRPSKASKPAKSSKTTKTATAKTAKTAKTARAAKKK
ncbi:universal stress protein [Janibacter sp. GS2]|uniref:universal stress protein n=1 Tax=Janibacter sp. GS2 TaxID=3442646 RepID=UPI003EB84A71